MTFGSDTMLNYQLFQKLKLIGRGKFNHLTITLTHFVSLSFTATKQRGKKKYPTSGTDLFTKIKIKIKN